MDERVPLVICPFRSLLHMENEDEKLRALRAARGLLEPDGRFVFDVFSPSREDIDETNGRWLEREPGIFERADWDEDARTLTLSVRSDGAQTSFGLHWLSVARVAARSSKRPASPSRPSTGGSTGDRTTASEDMIFVARATAVESVAP